MPTVPSKGKQFGDGTDTASNPALTEPHPTLLRNLVFSYLCHNCYLKTAEAFAKDSTIGHLDKDGNNILDRTATRDELGSQESSLELSSETVRNIILRQRIKLEILSGNVQEATDLLNRHFPKVLAEDAEDEMEVTDENVNPSQFEYIAETVDPTHLSLNLRILAFIEACRTVPLVYTPPMQSPGLSDADVMMDPASPAGRDPQDEESHQSELLICVQKLYATVSALKKSDDRAIYLKELSNVGGLLAYAVPENSPMAKYLHQERRDRVAEQINGAILYHTKMPSVSRLEFFVRHTHFLWAMLHEMRVKVPAALRLNGLSLPVTTSAQGTSESEKDSQEARPFDLRLLLDTKS